MVGLRKRLCHPIVSPPVAASEGRVMNLKWMLLDIAGHLVCIMIVINGLFDCLVFIPLLYVIVKPIFGYGSKTWQTCVVLLAHWVTPCVIGPLVSWSGLRVMMHDYTMWQQAKRKNILCFTNHSTRIDWAIARVVGFQFGPEESQAVVNFLIENFHKWLPGMGWHLNLICGDINISRSFTSDAVAIRKQIKAYQNNPRGTMLFVGAEGFIADDNEHGKAYQKNCQEFCKSLGYKPFKYVLTPRYKGMSVMRELVDHDKGVAFDVTMAWTRGIDNPVMLNVELDSPKRAIPDLYALVAGLWGRENRITAWIDTRAVDVPENPAELKEMMMGSWARKDKLLSNFHATGKFRESQQTWHEIPVQHFVFNVLILLHNLSVYYICYYTGTLFLLKRLVFYCLIPFLILNPIGAWVVGYTIESIPFETSIKPLLYLAQFAAAKFSFVHK